MAKTTLNFDDVTVSDFIAGAPLQEKKMGKGKEKRNQVISITLRQSDLDAMADYCSSSGLTRSSLIRVAVREYINNHSMK